MNTVFKELSFLGLREQDKITPPHIFSEHILRDQYTFTDFYKRENDEQYVIDDLYLEARIQEANNKADRKIQYHGVKTVLDLMKFMFILTTKIIHKPL